MFSTSYKYKAATTIAIVFHAIGLTGLLFLDKNFFIQATPFNLLLMLLLLLWTQKEKNIFFFIFLVCCFCIGIVVEIAGVKTGLLFGNYAYGNVLGYKWMDVPLLIGINWFIIIYCCGVSIHTLLAKISNAASLNDSVKKPGFIKALSVIIDGAILAVFFDWVMEPVAVKLGYWQWTNGEIPWYNYVCWFMISILLLIIFRLGKFNKQNNFAVNLLLIQLMFFLLLRTFMD